MVFYLADFLVEAAWDHYAVGGCCLLAEAAGHPVQQVVAPIAWSCLLALYLP